MNKEQVFITIFQVKQTEIKNLSNAHKYNAPKKLDTILGHF